MPEDIHPEAKRLLEDSGYLWAPWKVAFRRKRRVGIESTEEYRADPAIISYAELSDHGLAATGDAFQLSRDEKEQALGWLRDRIRKLEQ